MISKSLQRVSYSNVSTFLSCPRKWRLLYIDKLIQKQDSIDTVYGKAIHETIQDFLKQYYNNTLIWLSENKDDLIDKSVTSFMGKLSKMIDESKLQIEYPIMEKYVGFGIDLLQQFIPHVNKWFPKKNTQLFGVQVEISQKLDYFDVPFVGYIDVILYNKKEDKYKIIDLKTSMLSWKDNQKKDEVKRLQLILYKHFFSESKEISLDKISVQFIILKKMIFQSDFKISRIQTYEPPNSSITVKKSITFFKKTLKQMQVIVEQKKQGSMSPSTLCKYCPAYKKEQLCSAHKKSLKK